MDNFNLILLSGGFGRCDGAWSKRATGIDQCFKFYYVTDGGAEVQFGDETERLGAGGVYFLNGYRLTAQRCDRGMGHYWIHFIPESLLLTHLLRQQGPLVAVPMDDGRPFWEQVWGEMPGLFESRQGDHFRPAGLRRNRPLDQSCRIEAMLLYLLSHLLGGEGLAQVERIAPQYHRLQAGIAFMDREYLRNPSLREIARHAHLSPQYFHEVFTRTFQISPRAYMLGKRMHQAQSLLFGADMTIKEVAWQVGYDNEFYFSRVFKQHHGLSPSECRRARPDFPSDSG